MLGIHLSKWNKAGKGLFERLISTIAPILDDTLPPDLMLPKLIKVLEIDALQRELDFVLTKIRKRVRILIDRLDEGFDPTTAGVSVLAGAALATVLLNSAISSIDAYVFIRDNIARAISESDPDYSRNLESRVLRLHWEEQSLFYMICRRIRTAFAITEERDLRVWDKVSAQDVSGREGFRKCLRLTLYRPRDLILLLNKAFYRAGSMRREHIDNSDIAFSAKEISENRQRDLVFEYSSAIPGIEGFIAAFANSSPNLTFAEACSRIDDRFERDLLSGRSIQTLQIVRGSSEVLKLLYSVGFVGLIAEQGNSYVFSHDGKSPVREFTPQTKLLIHPCYWMSLNLQDAFFAQNEASEIHDDLDLEVTTDTTEVRNKKLGQMISDLDKIPEGIPGAKDFEDWCEHALKVIFAGSLENIRLHPNGTATQRRDVVARNPGTAGLWKRVLDDYESRQVIFEIKNFSRDLGPEEYRQMASYLGGPYGRLGFIINRSSTDDVRKDAELDWVREMYYHGEQKKLIVKITANTLTSLLSKLRSPEKYLTAEKRLGGLLDKYQTNYRFFSEKCGI